MPRSRAKGERVTIIAPLVPLLQQIQERRHFADLSETVNSLIRTHLEEHPNLVDERQSSSNPAASNNNAKRTATAKELPPSDDITSILNDLA